MEIDSEDYHDYVFRQGKLVGEFEQMYRKAKEIPWHQDKIADELDLSIAKSFARVRSPYDTILDVGCGLGYFAHELSGLGRNVYGIDVSPTAIQKLKACFPHIEARVADITERQGDRPLFPGSSDFDLVVCRGLFWYVFPRMREVVANVTAWVKDRGCLLIHQNFPDLEGNFVGKDVIPTPARLAEFFLEGGTFRVVYANVLEDRAKSKGNDNWHTFLLEKSGGCCGPAGEASSAFRTISSRSTARAAGGGNSTPKR